jgi:enoyl-CoA hydratase
VEPTLVRNEVYEAVATITLDQPDKRNPLSTTMLRQLCAAFEVAKADPQIRCVVLTGAGDKAFCAGADLSGFGGERTEVERHLERTEFVRLFSIMERLGKPIVACVNGHALAGGFGLAMACDLVVAADSATFGTPEITVGLWPMMIMAIIGRNLPRKRAMELYMTGDRIDAQRALEWGLVNRVVPQAEVREAAHVLARTLTTKSPLVMSLGRDAFYATAGLDQETALQYLVAQLTLVTLSEDSREGIAAFLEKRAPHFKGR